VCGNLTEVRRADGKLSCHAHPEQRWLARRPVAEPETGARIATTQEAIVAGTDLLRSESGEWLAIGGFDVSFRLSGADTDDAYSVVEYRVHPGRLIPPHTHSREREVSYVVEGELGLRVGADDFVVPSGGFAVKPPGVPHALWNPREHVLRVVEVISPAGFETYFQELAELYGAGGLPDAASVATLRDRYGIAGEPEWIPELKSRYGLALLGE
jgi:quercetin dioxygenase-like cupin family protein